MQRRGSLAAGETYHIYNRGAHKSAIFACEDDQRRFQVLLYLLNNAKSVSVREALKRYRGPSFGRVYSEPREAPRPVDVLAYCLMPNHFHLVLRQNTDDGVTCFLRKLGTAYSMYFNTKYEHSGVLFQGRFQSRHIDSESYFRWIFSYVHLNPIDLIDPGWKENGVADVQRTREFIESYRYSSFIDYGYGGRAEASILSPAYLPEGFIAKSDLHELLSIYTEDRPL